MLLRPRLPLQPKLRESQTSPRCVSQSTGAITRVTRTASIILVYGARSFVCVDKGDVSIKLLSHLAVFLGEDEVPRLFHIWRFQNYVDMFWTEKKVNAWVNPLQKIIESVSNTIALAPHAHDYWDRALFALRPVSVNPEKTEMVLQFYWLQAVIPLPHGSSILLPETLPDSYLVDPPIMPGNLESGGRDCHASVQPNLMLFDCQTRSVVSSGTYITIPTHDPEEYPLPDEECLWMQWTLHQFGVLCAAAGFQPEDSEDDKAEGAATVITPLAGREEG